MNPIHDYADAVAQGDLPAGKYHRLACERHLRDLKHQETAAFPYRFALDPALRFFRFAQKLRHYKGEWAKQKIVLQPYQQFRLGSLHAWRHAETGLRRYRTAYNEIPRKNGKSLEAATVALYGTFYDGEPGAEGYCIATKRDQAKIVWLDCKKLVQSSGLRSRIKALAANLSMEATSSKLEPLGADADSTDGLNPSLIIVDEFHKHKTRALIDVMESATGARRQPMNFQITTAGDDPISPCGDQHDYATKILEGVIDDPTFFAFIAHADAEDDWLDERTWRKANPNWNVSVKPEDMHALATKARNMPSASGEFKQKRLDLWVNASAPCLSIDGWRKGQSHWTEEEMAGESCYIGVDLASKIDLCALTLVFPPRGTRAGWRWLQRIWTPTDTLKDRSHRDRAPYQKWVDEGWLIPTPGTSIDHEAVRQAILYFRQRFQILQIGFDPWHADTPIKNLISLDGFPKEQVIEVPQTYLGMSQATLKVQALVLAAQVDARACPVTAWAASNAVAQMDGKDNMQFIKKKSRGRIDPLIAGTIATSLAVRREDTGMKDYFRVLNAAS